MNAERVWIFPSDKPLSETQIKTVQAHVSAFLSQWQAHGKDLEASFEIHYNRFLLIKVDPHLQQATGCSIDGLMQSIRALAAKLGVDFWDRWTLHYLKDGEVNTCHIDQISSHIANGDISPTTQVFNHTLTSAHDLDAQWLLPLDKSLYSRFI